MKDILISVIDAEKRGEGFVKDASIKAKEIILDAELEKENIKKSTEIRLKQKNSAHVLAEETIAQAEYDKLIAEGRNLADIYRSSKKTEKDSVKRIIIRRLLEKYGAC